MKRDGRREEFSKEKLISGLNKACQKRPVSPKLIEDLVERIVNEVTDKYEREVPAEVIGKLNREIGAALADPHLSARIADFGGTPVTQSPAEFGKFIVDYTEKWAKIIRAAGVKAE